MSKVKLVGENPVKAVRLALGLTQEQMALRLGCSVMTARRCEYEARLPYTKAVLDNFEKLVEESSLLCSVNPAD